MTEHCDRHGGSSFPKLPSPVTATETPHLKPVESAPADARRWILWPLGLTLLGPAYVALTVNYSDNQAATAIWAFFLILLGTPLAIVLLALCLHGTSTARRSRLADAILVYFLALLLWLDAGLILLDLSLMAGAWWIGYLVFAVVTPVLLVLVSGWRPGDRKRAIQRGVILWFAVALVPFVPWNDNKREGLLVRSVYGQPLEVLQERMDGMQVYVVMDTASDRQPLYGTVGVDFDLPTLNPEAVDFHSMGYCRMTIVDRRVTDVFFLYD